MPERTVSTIGELIEALEGPTKAAEALGATSPQQVVNWRLRGKISPGFFMKHQTVLKQRGIVAPASFWFEGQPA